MRTACTIILLSLLAAVAYGQSAAGPTIGDPIELDLGLLPGERVELQPVESVELIEQVDGRVIVRGFRPGTHALRFIATDETGSTREITGAVEIASVLGPEDDLEPAPLAPPLPLPPNRVAWIAIGVATAASIAVWLYLLWAPRTRRTPVAGSLSASEELMRTIERVRRMPPSDDRFAILSDAARAFLSRVDSRLGRELTTSEVLARLDDQVPEWIIADVRDILDEGDYAKFSPWGGRAGRFDSIVKEAADLAVLDRGRKSE